MQIDFDKVKEALKLLKEIEKVPLEDFAKQFGKYSKQGISEDIISDFEYIGTTNMDLIESNFLLRYGLKGL